MYESNNYLTPDTSEGTHGTELHRGITCRMHGAVEGNNGPLLQCVLHVIQLGTGNSWKHLNRRITSKGKRDQRHLNWNPIEQQLMILIYIIIIYTVFSFPLPSSKKHSSYFSFSYYKKFCLKFLIVYKMLPIKYMLTINGLSSHR